MRCLDDTAIGVEQVDVESAASRFRIQVSRDLERLGGESKLIDGDQCVPLTKVMLAKSGAASAADL